MTNMEQKRHGEERRHGTGAEKRRKRGRQGSGGRDGRKADKTVSRKERNTKRARVKGKKPEERRVSTVNKEGTNRED
jgi:hypothetical protein